MWQYISSLNTSRKLMIWLQGKFLTVLIMNGMPMYLLKLIKYVSMKTTVKYRQVNICLIHFLFRMGYCITIAFLHSRKPGGTETEWKTSPSTLC